MDGRFAGKRALVTGAGSGIGRATALRLAAEGAVVVSLDLSGRAASETADAIGSAGGTSAGWFAVDVGEEAAVREAVEVAVQQMGGLELLVTSAGITLNGRTESVSLDDWELVLRVNLTGTFLAIKHALPFLAQQRQSSIVTVGSVSSVRAAAGRVVSYDASKAGVLGLTRFVAGEYADRGVRVNCVAPGWVETNFAETSRRLRPEDPGWASPRSPEAVSRMSTVPMTRAADPSEVAGAIAFLCSDDASFITGAVLAVDGGWTAT